MSLDMTPERLSALAEQLEMTARNHDRAAELYAADGNAELAMAAGGRANAARDARTLAAALRAAAWLAVPGNRLIAETNDRDEIVAHEAYTEGSVEPTGVGLTALAAVLDAVGVTP
jgi:hypothetical protein